MSDARLRFLYGFTADDLNANREGYLTPRQYEDQRAQIWFGGFEQWLLAAATGIGGAVLLVLALTSRDAGAALFGGVLLLFAAAAAYAGYSASRAFRDDLRAGVVARATGQADSRKVVQRTRNGERTYYVVRIGALHLGEVSEQVQQAFMHEHCYHVYYLPRSRAVLSGEEIDCFALDAALDKAKKPRGVPVGETLQLVYTLHGESDLFEGTVSVGALRMWHKTGSQLSELHEDGLSALMTALDGLRGSAGWRVVSKEDAGTVQYPRADFRRVYTLARE